jgi:hypothetical protein
MALRKGKERIPTSEGGSSRSHCVEGCLWKRLWTCRQTNEGNDDKEMDLILIAL